MVPSFRTPRWTRERALELIFAGVIAAFVVANVVAVHASSKIDAASDAIVNNSAPSIASLAALRSASVDLELSLGHLVHGEIDEQTAQEQLAHAQAEMNRHLLTYLELPRFPGESSHWLAVQDACTRFDEAVKQTASAAATDRALAAKLYLQSVQPAADRVLAKAMEAIDFNAERGRHAAAQIKAIHSRAVLLSNFLTVICALLGISGGIVIRQLSRSRRLLLEARAAELEDFAGRIAHDIRSPLAGAHLAAHMLREHSEDPKTVEKANRILSALNRAEALIAGLLAFARASARPEPGARVDVNPLIADLLPALIADAERAQVELRVEPVPHVKVACSTGVYLSLVGNLMRNAMKYMGASPLRQVTLRISLQHDAVKTEVIDTGIGIAPEALVKLFQPWFRVHTEGGPSGFGLGLATVKRLAEGHGGSVGVRSSVGNGSTFWFVLPFAGLGSEADDASGADAPRGALPH